MAGTITRVCACARRLAQVGIRAAGVTLSWSISLAPIAQGLERTNFHGRTVSLRGGAGAAAGSVMAAIETGRLLRSGSRVRLAAALAAAAGGCAGLVDDLDAGAHDGGTPAKGLKGHLSALAHGRVTTGALKIAVTAVRASVGAPWRQQLSTPPRAPSSSPPGRICSTSSTCAQGEPSRLPPS